MDSFSRTNSPIFINILTTSRTLIAIFWASSDTTMVSPISTLCTIFSTGFSNLCLLACDDFKPRLRFLISCSPSSSRRRRRFLLAVLAVPRLISRRSCSNESSSAAPTKPSANGSSFLITIVVSVSVSLYLLAIWRICSRVRC